MRISLEGVTKSYGAQPILNDVTLAVGPRSRIGLVGPNGVGKSTLLRVLAGLGGARRGRRRPRAARAARRLSRAGARPIRGGAAHRVPRAPYRRRRGRAGTRPAHARAGRGPGRRRRLHRSARPLPGARRLRISTRVRAPSAPSSVLPPGSTARSPACPGARPAAPRWPPSCSPASTSSCSTSRQTTSTPTGSSGWSATSTALPGGVVVISHDRAFLDAMVDRIAAIEPRGHRLREWAGGWSEYAGRRDTERRGAYTAFEQSQERRREVSALLAQRRTEARAGGAKADRRGTHALMTKVRQAERALGRVDGPAKPFEPWELHLALRAGRRPGDIVAALHGAVVSRGDFRLGPVDLDIAWQERVVVTGPERLRQVDPARRAARRAAARGRQPRRRPPDRDRDDRPAPRSLPRRGDAARRIPGADRDARRGGADVARQVRPRGRRTSAGRPRRCHRASAHARSSPSSRRARSTCSSWTSRPTTSTWRRSSSSSRRSPPTTEASSWSRTTAASWSGSRRAASSGFPRNDAILARSDGRSEATTDQYTPRQAPCTAPAGGAAREPLPELPAPDKAASRLPELPDIPRARRRAAADRRTVASQRCRNPC